jgi:hypothetical protein
VNSASFEIFLFFYLSPVKVQGECDVNYFLSDDCYASLMCDRLLLDEDDVLSEVTQSKAVPEEVKEWLASTFTRNTAAQKRRTEDKPKFRTVANAIRAGIAVDK